MTIFFAPWLSCWSKRHVRACVRACVCVHLSVPADSQGSLLFFYDCCNTVILPLSAAIIVPNDCHIWQYDFCSVAGQLSKLDKLSSLDNYRC